MRIFGGLNTVWMVVMFDLPTDTRDDRRRYTQFRKVLLKNGYSMLQFSVYGRHCASDENAEVHEKRVVAALPPKGNIRIIKVTEKQFARMKTFYGKHPAKPKNRRFSSVFSEPRRQYLYSCQLVTINLV